MVFSKEKKFNAGKFQIGHRKAKKDVNCENNKCVEQKVKNREYFNENVKIFDLRKRKLKRLKCSMRIIHLGQLEHMWNKTFRVHQWSTTCRRPHFYVYKEKQVGLCVQQVLKCSNCQFQSEKHQLYVEKDLKSSSRGTRGPVTNLALNAALQDSSIGPQTMRSIISKLDLPVPSKTSMTQAGKDISQKLQTANKDDMIKHAKQAVRKSSSGGLHLSSDGRYNTSGPRSSRRRGTPETSQLIVSAIGKKFNSY